MVAATVRMIMFRHIYLPDECALTGSGCVCCYQLPRSADGAVTERGASTVTYRLRVVVRLMWRGMVLCLRAAGGLR